MYINIIKYVMRLPRKDKKSDRKIALVARLSGLKQRGGEIFSKQSEVLEKKMNRFKNELRKRLKEI